MPSRLLRRRERPEAPGDEQVDRHDRERDQREGGSEGDVVRDPDAVVDDVADERRLPNELNDDVIAEGEREREDRASDDPGDDQREDDLPEGSPSSSPEIR